MTEWKAFEVESKDHIAQVTLTGPGKGNAMGPDFWRELPLVFGELDADPEVRAIVLTGSGKHFSYGLDLPAMSPLFGPLLADKALAGPRTDFLKHVRSMQDSVTAVADCAKPVIAAISGWCIGGGLDLIAAADVRLASADAKFSLREAKVAIVADIGRCTGCRGSSARGTCANSPTPARTSTPRGPRRSVWSTTCSRIRMPCSMPPTRWPAKSRQTRRWWCGASRMCWISPSAGGSRTGCATCRPGTPRSCPPRT
ncbi:enoyl-CoA hydratase [Nocardia seriolae]|nr:enoyl-CoA hydratase [Nocardia seriolae]